MILIRHDHQVAISQAIGGCVVGIVFEPKNLPDVLNLDILHYCFMTCVSYVEQLAPQRENAIVVSTNDAETRDGESFRRVTFCQNQGTTLGVSATGVICVFKLDNPRDTVVRYISLSTNRDRFEPSIFFKI
jgi:hypothetical protein